MHSRFLRILDIPVDMQSSKGKFEFTGPVQILEFIFLYSPK